MFYFNSEYLEWHKKYILKFEDEDLNGLVNKGSYNVLGARLLNLSYPEYLRMCRDKYDGEIKGKQGYSYVLFKDKSKLNELLNILETSYKKNKNVIREALIANGLF